MLAHLLTIFSGFFAPLIIYLAKGKESQFVKFHSLQALVWQIAFTAVWFGAMIFVAVGTVSRGLWVVPMLKGAPSPELFLGFFAIWGAMMFIGFANVGCCVYMAIQANAGKWGRYPLIGRLVERYGGNSRRS